jgi:tetratricopeptide (TPR) repeat protein
VLVGKLIDDRFLVEDEAASGGMGTVFRAVDRQGGGVVALKILHGQDFIDVERFVREAAILAELDHPGIVRYIGHGLTGTGEHYLAMEWLDGEDLAARLVRRPLSEAEALTVMRQAAEALGAAHARGAVHRDIKPSNLFLRERDLGRLAVVDFGIAGFIDRSSRLTQTGTLLGTPGYAAPEQVQGSTSYDARSDVFSLGCVFFECVAQRPAFEGANPMAVLAKLLLQDPPRLADLRPGIAEPLDALVSRMLSRDPEKRPQSLREVVEAIDVIAATCTLRPAVESVPAPTLASDDGGMPAEMPLSERSQQALTRKEQRLVTLVFAGRDPSIKGALAALRRAHAAELAAAVEPIGGHLTALADGALIITTWTPGTAVDRAERAARCALAVNARFPDLPIAVVTGRGQVASRVVEGAVIDRGVHALARTKPGVARIDEATAAMIAPRFELQRDDDTIALVRPTEGRDGPPLLLGRTTACVGRNRELAMLEGIFEGCIAEPVASAALVIGPAGSGKSRLRRELVDKLRRRGTPVSVMVGHADSVAGPTSLGAIADLIRHAAGIRPADPVEHRREKLTARLARRIEGPMLERVASFLGELIGAPFPDRGDAVLLAARESPILMADAIRAAWEEWLLAECAAEPVILVLEDLQWGDAATAQLIDSTLRNLKDLPLLVIALARSEAHTELLEVWTRRDVPVVKLGPLPGRACEKLVRDALGPETADAIVRGVVERAGGNPFYLEELIRVVAAGGGDALPDSVLGIVEARLDAEGAEAKRILRAASVFGDRFSAAGVAALVGGERDPLEAVLRTLGVLAAHELVASAPFGPVAAAEYVFCHTLVREAAYAMLTEADRALGHRLAADFLERRGHADAMALAEHFRRGVEPARAVRWYRRAAEQALEANDLGAALDRAALGLAGGAVWEDRAALRLVEAEAHAWRGELKEAETSGLEAVSLFAPGSAPWFRAITHVVSSAGKLGAHERVGSWAGVALRAEAGPDARRAQILCLSECASRIMFRGDYAAADEVIAAIDRLAALGSARDGQVSATIASTHAVRALFDGDLGAARERLIEAQDGFEAAGDLRNTCTVQSNLGFVLIELGDYAGAEEALRAALAGAERMGLQDLAAAALQNLGCALGFQGDLEEARRLEQRAIDASRKLGDPRMEGVARMYLARIGLISNDFAAAERAARVAVDLLQVAPPLRASACAVLARALLGLGRDAEAHASAGDAFATLEALGALEEGETLVRLVYAETLARAGARAELTEVIGEARARLLARAAKISDPALRERFLRAVPDNARTLDLASSLV